jgi:hypothetical protein
MVRAGKFTPAPIVDLDYFSAKKNKGAALD